MRYLIIALLFFGIFPTANAADPYLNSAEEQLRRELRDIRSDMRTMEINREADRAIDAIRAREDANRQQLQRNVDDAMMRQRIETQQYWAPIRPRY